MGKRLTSLIRKLGYLCAGRKKIRELNIPDGKVFFSCGGIGDSLYAGLFVDEYVRENNVDRLTLFAPENHRDVFELCRIQNAEVVYYKSEIKKALYYYLAVVNRLRPDFCWKLLQPMALRENYETLSRQYTLEEVYKKYIFHLDMSYSPMAQLIPLTRGRRKEIEPNAVFIVVESNSIPSMSDSFWKSLIGSFLDVYPVYINSASYTDAFAGRVTDLSTCSIAELFEMAPCFRYIISIRNGMCDLMGKQKCHLLTLYPYDEKKDYFQMFSMRRIAHSADIVELQERDFSDCSEMLREIREIVG